MDESTATPQIPGRLWYSGFHVGTRISWELMASINVSFWEAGGLRIHFYSLQIQYLGRFLGTIGQDPSVSQVQPLTWWHLSVVFFFYKIGVSSQSPETSTASFATYSGALHTWAKSRDHEIVRAQKKVSKGCCPLPTHLRNHVVWSHTFKCNMKS